MATRENYGSFIPTTSLFDVSDIYETEVSSREFKDLIVRLYQNQNSVNLHLNQKDTGIYDKSEFVTGKTYFVQPGVNSSTTATVSPSRRPVFRKVIDFGALPNNTTKSVAHGISFSAGYTLVDCTCTATDPAALKYIPIPYASATSANVVELDIDGTNINITTGKDMTSYTRVYITVEYLKQS